MKLRLGEWPFGNLDRLRELLRRVQMEETDFWSLKFPPFLGEIPNSAQHFYGLHPHFLFIRSPFREPKNTLKILVATQSLLVKSHLCCLFQSPQSIPSEFLSPFLIGALRDHSATGPLARCDQVTLPGLYYFKTSLIHIHFVSHNGSSQTFTFVNFQKSTLPIRRMLPAQRPRPTAHKRWTLLEWFIAPLKTDDV
jgi:hypothetical protein